MGPSHPKGISIREWRNYVSADEQIRIYLCSLKVKCSSSAKLLFGQSSQPVLPQGPTWGTFQFPLLNCMSFLTFHFSSLWKSLCWAALPSAHKLLHSPSLVSMANLLMVHSIHAFHPIVQVIRPYWTQYWPLGVAVATSCHLDFALFLITTLWASQHS